MADSTDYKRWIERAKQDIRLLEIIKGEGIGGTEDSFCYICHQATEKLLKAFLLKYEKSLLKTHDLVFLMGKCMRYGKEIGKLEDALTVLNEYAVSARYPDDFSDKRTVQEAKEAFDCVEVVYNVVSVYLR